MSRIDPETDALAFEAPSLEGLEVGELEVEHALSADEIELVAPAQD